MDGLVPKTGGGGYGRRLQRGKGIGQFTPLWRRLLSDKIAQWTERGMPGHPIRVMVAGIPNSGKSSLINRLPGGGKAKWRTVPASPGTSAGSVPGRDRAARYPRCALAEIRGSGRGETAGVYRRYPGSGPGWEGLACALLVLLRDRNASALRERYRLSGDLPEAGYALLEEIGRRRGMLISGGEVTPSGRRRCCSTSSGPAGSGG